MAGQMRWSAPPIVERAPPPETARVGSRCQHEGARLRLVLGFLLPSQRGQGVQSGQVPNANGSGWAPVPARGGTAPARPLTRGLPPSGTRRGWYSGPEAPAGPRLRFEIGELRQGCGSAGRAC